MNKTKGKKRKEHQAHGFKFEDYVIEEYGLIKEANYTAEWDAYTNNGIPVSIKTSEIDSEICFGDIFRQASIEVNGFYLVIGFWEGITSNIKDIYVLPIKSKDWHKIFNEEAIEHLRNMLDIAGNGDYYNKEDKELWDNLRDKCKEVWENNTLNIMRPRFRWVKPTKDYEDEDEGKHRIQCAIRYNSFMDNFINNDYFKKYRYDYNKNSSYKYTKVTETKTVEDTKYGKKITETKITETIEADKALQAHFEWLEILKKKAKQIGGDLNEKKDKI